MRSVGIDLGEDSIKIVDLLQNKKNITIQAVFEKRLSPVATQQDKEIECIEFVRDILSKNDFSNATFVMTVKQDKATVRKKLFPFSDRLKINKSISFEMEEDIPFDPDNCIFDYKVIQYSGSSADTLVAAVPKTHIAKIVQLAKDFNIQLKLISLEGFSFSNLIERWSEAPPVVKDNLNLESFNEEGSTNLQKAEVFLNLGHKKTLMCARVNGRVVFIRSLMWGSDIIIQELIKRYQLPYSEAQKTLERSMSFHLIKKNLSFEESGLSTIVEKCMKDLVRDIQMSFLEIESELKAEVTEVHLSGGFSLVPNCGAFLTQQLEVSCNPINLISEYLPETKNQDDADSLSARFSTAVGIALESYKRPKNPATQLLKGEFADDNNFFKTYWEEWGSITQVFLAGTVVFFVWTGLRESFSLTLTEKGTEAIETQAKSVAKLPKKQANEKGVKKYIADNKKKAQELKAVSHLLKMNSALDVLNKISASAPSKDDSHIDIMQLEIKDSRVYMTGYANSPREVSLLSQKLSDLSLNKKVNEEATQLKPTPNRVAFGMSFNIDRGTNSGGAIK